MAKDSMISVLFEQVRVHCIHEIFLFTEFSVLLKLLDSENEMSVGNAAFCLGQCLVVPGAATSLLNSNIVMALLKHAGGDAARTSVQENAAIALGKLCVAEPRYCKKIPHQNQWKQNTVVLLHHPGVTCQ